jgi:hypothetical protein
MRETVQGAQAKVDRHAAGPHPTGLAGKPGGVLPTAGTDGFALLYNAATGTLTPTAISGTPGSASKADPLNFGFPYSCDPRTLALQAGVGTANRTFYYRLQGGGSVSKIGLYVSTASGNVCVSLYANTGTGRASAPGARVATSGSVVCPAAGYQEITLGSTVTVTSGDYWVAISADNTTAQFGGVASNGWAVQGLEAWEDGGFPSPATATPAAGAVQRLFGLIGAP